jgi:hypothetical protein
MSPTIDLWGYLDELWFDSPFISGKQCSLKGCQTNQTNTVADTAVDIVPPKEKPRPCHVHGI